MDQDTTWYRGRPQPSDIVLDGDPAPPSPKGAQPHPPNFWPMSVVAKWLDGLREMPLSMEVGLGPGDFVLDEDPSPPKNGTAHPTQFSARLLWPNSWMDQDATWYGRRPGPRRCFVRWGPSSP